jgi:hypothetical protein
MAGGPTPPHVLEFQNSAGPRRRSVSGIVDVEEESTACMVRVLRRTVATTYRSLAARWRMMPALGVGTLTACTTTL